MRTFLAHAQVTDTLTTLSITLNKPTPGLLPLAVISNQRHRNQSLDTMLAATSPRVFRKAILGECLGSHRTPWFNNPARKPASRQFFNFASNNPRRRGVFHGAGRFVFFRLRMLAVSLLE